MNIFVTDKDSVQAARNLCDKHVRAKMQVEGSIMLAHAFEQELLNHPSTPKTKTGKSRRRGKGYFKHQCSVWVRESRSNFKWLVDHTLEMFDERMYRWPDSKEHFTKDFIVWCKENTHNTIMSDIGLTPFAIAIGEDCNCRTLPHFNDLSTIDKYRSYIINDKDFADWTRRQPPTWFNNLPQYGHLRCDVHQYQSKHLAA